MATCSRSNYLIPSKISKQLSTKLEALDAVFQQKILYAWIVNEKKEILVKYNKKGNSADKYALSTVLGFRDSSIQLAENLCPEESFDASIFSIDGMVSYFATYEMGAQFLALYCEKSENFNSAKVKAKTVTIVDEIKNLLDSVVLLESSHSSLSRFSSSAAHGVGAVAQNSIRRLSSQRTVKTSNGKQCYVSNLPPNINEEKLSALFGGFGKVSEVCLVKEEEEEQRKKQNSKFAFVTLSGKEEVKNACYHLNNKRIWGTVLYVSVMK